MPKSVLEQTVDQFRRDLLARERQAASQMVRQYGEAWKRIQAQITALAQKYYTAEAAGTAKSSFWLYEFERLQSLRRQVEAELYRFAQDAEAAIRVQQAEAMRAGGRDAYELMQAAARGARFETVFGRLPASAIENMIGTFQAMSPVHMRLQQLAALGAQAVEDGLVQGLILGQGPRVIARNIRDALGQGLSKALVWARTEPLRAYRTASLETYRMNSNVVEGWVWRSARNSRTCASCWSMDGTVHKLEETLDDHPCGRCFAVPKLPGTPTKQTGAQAFAKLSEAKQREILGSTKWEAWKDGKITLDQDPLTGIVGQKWDQRWGSMRYERSLREMGISGKSSGGASQEGLLGVSPVQNDPYLLIEQYENQIVADRLESAYAVNQQGELVLHKVGTKNSVSFTDEELGKLENTIFTHNHPDGLRYPQRSVLHQGNSFSDSDIMVASINNLSEIRAVTPEWRYRMLRPSTGWNRKYWTDTIKPEFDKANADVRRIFTKMIADGEMSVDDASVLHWHMVWERVSRNLGLEYNRSRIIPR